MTERPRFHRIKLFFGRFKNNKKNVLKVPAEPQEQVEGFNHSYELLSTKLGAGVSAIVHAAYRRDKNGNRGEKVAVKQINIEEAKVVEEKLREVDILKRLRHKHIVRVIDAYQEETFLFIVMERAEGGDLFVKIVKEDNFDENDVRNICFRLFSALHHMYERKVVHRDIKPANILLKDPNDLYSVQFCDFGFSVSFPHDVDMEMRLLETKCGSRAFMAPKLGPRASEPVNYKTDVWAMGVLVYVLLTSYTPFGAWIAVVNGQHPLIKENREIVDEADAEKKFAAPEDEIWDRLLAYEDGEFDYLPETAWENISDRVKVFLAKVFQVDPRARPNYDEILADPWFIGLQMYGPEDVITEDTNLVERFANKIDTGPLVSLRAQMKMLNTMQVHAAVERFRTLMLSEEKLEEERRQQRELAQAEDPWKSFNLQSLNLSFESISD
eukprot:maker-scaffold_12-snap-gene-4.40-mRNA-1 protein AED:0.01 eAED:0.01 QI:107/1/1/1/1/1/4/101/439